MGTRFLKYIWLILVFSVLSSPVLAVTIPNPLQATSFTDLINGIIDFIFRLSLAVVPLMIVIAGVIFITGAGDTGKIQQAKNIILYTIIGFVIILLAKSITTIIRDILGVGP